MLKNMKTRVAFLAVFTAFIIVACAVTTAICAQKYTAMVYYFNGDVTIVGTSFKSENGHVDVKNVVSNDLGVQADFVPKSIGYDTVTFYTVTTDSDQDMEYTMELYSGPFNTVFSCYPDKDFNNSVYVVFLVMLEIAVFAAVLIYSFVDLVKKAKYCYTMVACGGIGIFCLHFLGICIFTLIGSLKYNYKFDLGTFLYDLTKSGGDFSRSISVGMALFCAILIVSNISLIRHEGFRIQNLLGVVLGAGWVAGYVLSCFLEEKSRFDLNDIYTPVSNGVSVVISYFECMLISTTLSAFLASRSQPPLDRDYIVIFGCAIKSDGSLMPLLKGRVDAAVSFAEKQLEATGRQAKLVPSGGQGSDEIISEGEAMKRYLVENGFDEKYILPETKSVNTYENVKLSKQVIEGDTGEEYNPAFATTNYHVFRGYILCDKLGLKNARGISSKTKWYFFPNAFLRELAGLIVDKWKLHLVSIIIILALFTAIYYTA